MKVAGGLKEDNVVIGNVFDKYGSRNPIVRWMMNGFEQNLSELVGKAAPRTIHEVGCGEGYWVMRWNSESLSARGSDFSSAVIEMAQANAIARGISPDVFAVRSIYDLEIEKDGADLIVCCEVMEHLEHPEKALATLQKIARNNVILSVPREPLWRVLNMARGKYLGDFGNTEGHLQHWSQKGFVKLVSRYFDVVETRAPLPWTMLLCRARQQ
ncbi:class I SAM-dependent methyltransferase [Nitratireductor rhodophyticola]|uniref:class I SAM-dependent methyltransferase n=1 Tax=Nitratireductor rhodophyticola TaxID=2854036 RepID=UPI002ECB82DA|nr:class I SAM-dependent methyltransferase [Pseudomonadota bacterium]